MEIEAKNRCYQQQDYRSSGKRAANIELLRCILMFLIVFGHCFSWGIYKGADGLWTVLVLVCVIWNVDCFLGISGWFGIRFSWKKVWKLYSQILFYSVLSALYLFFFDHAKFTIANVKVYGGWYGSTYLFLMFIAPLLNMIVDRASVLPRAEVLKAWGLSAFGLFCAWAPFHLFTAIDPFGIADGFSIAMFAFVYVTVRLLRVMDFEIKRKHLLWGVLIYIAFVLAPAIVFGIKNFLRDIPLDRHIFCYNSYHAPHVWILAVVVLVYFARFVQVWKGCEKLILFLSPSMFGIYLLHNGTSFGDLIFVLPERYLAENYGWHPLAIIFVCAVLTFGICLATDLLRRLLFWSIGLGYRRLIDTN